MHTLMPMYTHYNLWGNIVWSLWNNHVLICSISLSYWHPTVPLSPLAHVWLFTHISHISPEVPTAGMCLSSWVWAFLFIYLAICRHAYTSPWEKASAYMHTHTHALTPLAQSHTHIHYKEPTGSFTAAHCNAPSHRPFISQNVLVGAE